MARFEFTDGRFSAREEGDGKQIILRGPANFSLDVEIDHDDVSHDDVHGDTILLVKLLNRNWPKK